MKRKIYSLYDEKAGAYANPFYMENDLTAVRAVSHAVNGGESNLSLSPSDFKLYCLGEFDDNSGGIDTDDVPRFVSHLEELKQQGD